VPVPSDDEDPYVQAAIAGELRLLETSVRHATDKAEALLHPDFFEFGASGRCWTRDEIIAMLAEEPAADGQEAVATVSDMTGTRLADDVVLVTYTTERLADANGRPGRRCHRSTIWRRTPEGWRAYFHQGTVIP
jgi:hypothetical protein